MYRFVSITHRHTQKKKLILKNYVGNWLVGKKRKKIEKKMNEFVAYYKNFFVNFRNDPKKMKKKIKGEKRTKEEGFN